MSVIIPTVNLQNGEVIIFSSKETRHKISDAIKYITDVPIDIAVRSSCSYPGVFSPCMYKNLQLVDGGIRENVAWKELKEIGATKVVGVNFISDLGKDGYCDNMIEVATRSINLMSHELSNYELEGIDELITITTKKVGLLDTKMIDYLYKTGYETTKKYLSKHPILLG